MERKTRGWAWSRVWNGNRAEQKLEQNGKSEGKQNREAKTSEMEREAEHGKKHNRNTERRNMEYNTSLTQLEGSLDSNRWSTKWISGWLLPSCKTDQEYLMSTLLSISTVMIVATTPLPLQPQSQCLPHQHCPALLLPHHLFSPLPHLATCLHHQSPSTLIRTMTTLFSTFPPNP